MSIQKDCLLIACGVACLSFGQPAASSGQALRYEPSRPTVSPYLNLFREPTGALPNYYSFVRPLQLQREANLRQQRINQQNAAVVKRLGVALDDVQQRQEHLLQMTPTGKNAWFLQPSRRQQFMNTSRYYSRSGSRMAR